MKVGTNSRQPNDLSNRTKAVEEKELPYSLSCRVLAKGELKSMKG
jgi:hypothetical protein